MVSRTVLFVDDDVLTQWTMSDALSDSGFKVISACRGREAASLLMQNRAEFDLLISDLELPDGIGGAELGHLWHQTAPGRPVLLIGRRSHPSVFWLQNCQAFLPRPFTAEMLIERVESLLEAAAFMPGPAPFAQNLRLRH